MTKVILSLVLIFAAITAILAVQAAGHAARVYGSSVNLSQESFPLYLVRNTTDVYSLWREKHAHGRVVVHMGKFLHFVEPDSPEGYRVSKSYPLTFEKLCEGEVTYRNFLWAAMQSNVARELYHVVTPHDFRERFGLGDDADTGKNVIEQTFGSRRTLSTRIPSVSEPVLLNIDASFFSSMDIASAVQILKKSGLSVDVVTVCLAEDSPDVTSLERQSARDFATRLSAGGTITRYGFHPTTGAGVKR